MSFSENVIQPIMQIIQPLRQLTGKFLHYCKYCKQNCAPHYQASQHGVQQ